MIEDIKEALLSHAREMYPKECCGLVVVFKGRNKYIPCENVSDNRNEEFVISAVDYAKAEEIGEIIAVCHSHPNGRSTPSQSDLSSCEKHGVPWIIVGYPLGEFTQIEPSGYKAPLIGRKFAHGVHDCYSLAVDYYHDLGISLPDFDRCARWWDKGFDLLNLENFKKAGFYEITASEVREHDAIICQNGANIPNHCMIYLGSNTILHHVENRLSSRDVYGGYYFKNSRYFLRHEKLT